MTTLTTTNMSELSTSTPVANGLENQPTLVEPRRFDVMDVIDQ